MKAVENQTLLKQLKWRYATKKFDPAKKISAEDWNALEQAVILSASSYGLQPWHFTVITSQKVKDELREACHGQHQVSQASHVVVFSVNKAVDAAYVEKHIQRISEVRGVPVEKLAGYKGTMVGTIANQDSATTEAWCARQVYIALGTLLTSAAMLGIDACPMEGIMPAKFDEILGLSKKGLATVLIAAVGYRASDDSAAHHPKVRFKPEDLVTHVD
jgi:nitroreductase